MDVTPTKMVRVVRAAAAVGILAIAACGAPSTGAPPVAPAPQVRHQTSWMAPAAAGSSLMYVSDNGNYKLYVYTYPKGKLVGTIDTAYGSPTGLCTDAVGNVFVVETVQNKILEYAHGGTAPIATLSDGQGSPNGCAVDRTTGNLAVTNEYGPSGGYGNVLVYPKAQGTPQMYSLDSAYLAGPYFCAYDPRGNLYINGVSDMQHYNRFGIQELVKGQSAFKNISLAQSVSVPGGMVWDGKHIAIGDEAANPSVIYQLSIVGSAATVVGTTTLQGTSRVQSFTIPLGSIRVQGTRVIAPSIYGPIGFYGYPAGGTATLSIHQNQPYAAVVSKVPATPAPSPTP